MISICKRFEFDAAHYLPNHEGKCRNLHGHRYVLDVEITGKPNTKGPATGMIIDFSDLKQAVNKVIIDVLDHTCLNESLPSSVYPTAEEMVVWIAARLKFYLDLDGEKYVSRVRLYETPTAYAEWRRIE